MQSNDIALKLEKLRASMHTLTSTIEATEREYTEAVRRESVIYVPVKVIASLDYTMQMSRGILCSGLVPSPFLDGSTTSGARQFR